MKWGYVPVKVSGSAFDDDLKVKLQKGWCVISQGESLGGDSIQRIFLLLLRSLSFSLSRQTNLFLFHSHLFQLNSLHFTA